MSIEIRIMKKSDYAEAIALWRSLPGLGLSKADEESAIGKFLEKNPLTCFVALTDNQIVGTILGGSDTRRGYIYHLAVKKDIQKQGVGRKLVETCLNALREQGLQKCHIFVIKSNAEGRRFWANIGWQERHDIEVMSVDL
jgi:ribosomal protein S18 acetylase RimI-like enzyme